VIYTQSVFTHITTVQQELRFWGNDFNSVGDVEYNEISVVHSEMKFGHELDKQIGKSDGDAGVLENDSALKNDALEKENGKPGEERHKMKGLGNGENKC
jgi:hypothetical protein